MSYVAKGKIKLINDIQTFGSGFQKRDFVLTVDDGKYSQDIVFQLTGDKVSFVDQLAVGTECDVSFNIRGKEYNGRYFNNLDAWKIVSVAASNSASDVSQGQTAAEAAAIGDTQDEIPF